MAWDPKTYLAFAEERTRPARDLLARIPLKAPKRIADLGCGPANSTALLRTRWPDARIDGIDHSREMLADARKSGVDANFVEADIARWMPEAPYDLIYSNAALQWLRGHETLFPRLFSFVAPGGVLAIQVPRNYDELCQVVVRDIVSDARWAEKLRHARDWWNGLPVEAYYDLLAPAAAGLDIWETRYIHIVEGEDPVYHWMLGTSLRPFAAALESPMREDFLEECRRRLANAYRPRPDGKIIHPFLRLFLVVRKRNIA